MSLAEEKYFQLVEWAEDIVRNSTVDPLDLVHEVWIHNTEPTRKDLRVVFFNLIREARKISPLEVLEKAKNKYKAKEKYCRGCNDYLPLSAFYPNSNRAKCILCLAKYKAAYRKKNRKIISEKAKKYYQKNRKQYQEKAAAAYKKNCVENKAKSRAYYRNNKEKVLVSIKKWRTANPKKVKKHQARYNKKKIAQK